MSPPASVVQLLLPQDEYFKGPTETRAIICGKKYCAGWGRVDRPWSYQKKKKKNLHNSWKGPGFQSQHPHQPGSCRDLCDSTCSKYKGVNPSLAFHARDFRCELASVMANSAQGDTEPSLAHAGRRKFSCSDLIVNLSQRVSVLEPGLLLQRIKAASLKGF